MSSANIEAFQTTEEAGAGAMKYKLTRRRFLGGCIAAGVGIAVDMRLVEPRWLRLASVNVPLPGVRLAHPIKIFHMSDMHASGRIPASFIRKAIELGISQKPDLACITGDLISRHIPDRSKYVENLSFLSATCPCFACVGNHDGGRWVAPQGGYRDVTEMRRLLDDSDVTLLFNSSREIAIKGNSIELVGLGDYWARDTKPSKAFPSNDDSHQTPRIVLSHNPDSKELLQKYTWDLMLCGHTHGGQLSLPIVGTPFAPVDDHRYVYGLNQWDGRLIYTTRGVGNLHGLRFNCRPEVAILNLS
ncbi:phosphodiesterase YaeI [Verrucomicrobiota bacterium]